ncbi:hypothetical protein D3C86_1180770 [compost metagenome]
MRARELDDLGHAAQPAPRMRSDDQRKLRHQGHRREVLQRVVAHIGIDRRVEHQNRNIASQQRVAVRRFVRHPVGGQDSGRARAVVDHHALLEPFAQPRAHRARQGIRAAPSGKAHHPVQGARRIRGGLRPGKTAQRHGQGACKQGSPKGRMWKCRAHACLLSACGTISAVQKYLWCRLRQIYNSPSWLQIFFPMNGHYL